MRPRASPMLGPLLTLLFGVWSCASCASGPPGVTKTASTGAMTSATTGSSAQSIASTPSNSSSDVSSSASAAPSITPTVAASTSSSAFSSASSSASIALQKPSGITIGPGTKVFLFGDSMVTAGLGQRFEKLVKARGGTYDDNHWSSSTTKKWSESERLPNLLFKHKPDVVFVAIGSNEVYYLDKHADEFVKTIVKKLGGKPCVWIGPPVWKKQTGIVETERDNSSPCAFFDSSTLQLDRQPDGIHPSLKGGATWADAVWAATVAPVTPVTP